MRTLLRIVGRLRAFQGAIPNGQLLCWELGKQAAQLVVRVCPDAHLLVADQLRSLWVPLLREKIFLDSGALRAARCIQLNIKARTGRQWDDEGVVRLVADAGPQRAAARFLKSMAFPDWIKDKLQDRQSLRELIGMWMGAQTFVEQLQARTIVRLAALRSLRNGPLAPWVAEVLWYLMDNNIKLHQCHWIPGRELVRRGVDGLSRFVDVNDWTLAP